MITKKANIANVLKNLHFSKNEPISLVHFITNRCNARCSFCFIDFDNPERYLPLAGGVVNGTLATQAAIELVKSEYPDKQVFYAYTDAKFYQLTVAYNGLRTIAQVTGYITYVGRQGLYFQYRHNAPLSRRIDPGTTNIIDIYLLTQNYSDAYAEYVQDTSATIMLPTKPTVNSLRSQFSSLEGYKSLSDALVMHSAKFKPLFGLKADSNLRASFKVVKNPGYNISDSEIKSKLVAALNQYFAVENWDFGETFYFSELSAYLHTTLTPFLNSVVIVPTSGTQAFGSLYQISCEHDEIFVNAATVNDVAIIGSITASNIKATGEVYTGSATTSGTSSITTTSSGSGGGGGGGY